VRGGKALPPGGVGYGRGSRQRGRHPAGALGSARLAGVPRSERSLRFSLRVYCCRGSVGDPGGRLRPAEYDEVDTGTPALSPNSATVSTRRSTAWVYPGCFTRFRNASRAIVLTLRFTCKTALLGWEMLGSNQRPLPCEGESARLPGFALVRGAPRTWPSRARRT
jgi:hypothetical protein